MTYILYSGEPIKQILIRMKAFEKKNETEDRPRSVPQGVTTRGQDRCIRNTHLRNRFQTATATAADTHRTHNNHISA